MPTNLYGPGDNFDLQSSHVLPALIRKFHEAKQRGDAEVVVWGTGTPRREFLHVDDLADACVFLMERYDSERARSMSAGARTCRSASSPSWSREVVGFTGELAFDTDQAGRHAAQAAGRVATAALGWTPQIPLRAGHRGRPTSGS